MVHQTETLEIEIIGEASKVHRHTSAMLDVKTRANEIEFFNIIVDESPIIPYEIYRRYVAGSPSGSMTITGDTVGENLKMSMFYNVNIHYFFSTVIQFQIRSDRT